MTSSQVESRANSRRQRLLHAVLVVAPTCLVLDVVVACEFLLLLVEGRVDGRKFGRPLGCDVARRCDGGGGGGSVGGRSGGSQ